MSARRGFALLIVLGVLLLIEAMAAGMLALATQARAAANQQLRTARAEAGATLAARTAIASWEANGADTLPSGTIVPLSNATGSEADATWAATIERVQSQFVMRAQGRVGGALIYSKAQVIALARMLDRSAVLAELDAAVKSGGAVLLTGSAMVRDRDSTCSALPSSPPNAVAAGLAPAMAPTATVVGAIVVDSLLKWPDSTALANASWGDIAAVADRIESGVVMPMPVASSGACDTTTVANWGDPAPGSPCGAYAPLIYSPGDLTISGGRGQGIVVVAGAFAMSGNAMLKGAVVARDGIVIDGHATLDGAALSRRGYVLIQDAELTYSPCELRRALAATRATRRLLPQKRRYLPVF
jgi:Tfp pilus assembly protein PilX